MGNISICTFILMFCLGNAKLKENWMNMKKQHKSVGCDSIENVKVVSKVECAMLFAQRSDVNLADFNVLQLICELKFCNQIYDGTFLQSIDYSVIHNGFSTY